MGYPRTSATFEETKKLMELRLREEIYQLAHKRRMRETAQDEQIAQLRASTVFVAQRAESDTECYDYDELRDESVRFGLKISVDVSTIQAPTADANLEAEASQAGGAAQTRSIAESTTLIRSLDMRVAQQENLLEQYEWTFLRRLDQMHEGLKFEHYDDRLATTAILSAFVTKAEDSNRGCRVEIARLRAMAAAVQTDSGVVTDSVGAMPPSLLHQIVRMTTEAASGSQSTHRTTPLEATQQLDGSIFPPRAVVLPGGADYSTTAAITGPCSAYFHLDSAGKTCFSKEEADRAGRRAEAIELVKDPRSAMSPEILFCSSILGGSWQIVGRVR